MPLIEILEVLSGTIDHLVVYDLFSAFYWVCYESLKSMNSNPNLLTNFTAGALAGMVSKSCRNTTHGKLGPIGFAIVF